MNNTDQEYFRLLNAVLSKGKTKHNRTGVDTIGIFGEQARFDLSKSFPLLTSKKIFTKGIIHELLWFIKGDTNIKYLVDNDVHIWDAWAYDKYKKNFNSGKLANNEKLSTSTYCDGKLEHRSYFPLDKDTFIKKIKEENEFSKKWGELGEGTYGGMWRKFPYANTYCYQDDNREQIFIVTKTQEKYVDQISKVIEKLKNNPDDRRLIVSAWHPYWVDHCALPPCHVMFQFHTEELTISEREELVFQKTGNEYDRNEWVGDKLMNEIADEHDIPTRKLNCQLYQRSCDLFLGVPFNIASYSLLTCMIAQCVNMIPGEFIHTYGDLHIYSNHLEQVKLQLSREPYPLPALRLNQEVTNLFDFKYEDIQFENYQFHPTIRGEVAV